MEYADFRIRIRRTRPGPYEVTVEESPVGGATLENWRPPASREIQRGFSPVPRDEGEHRELGEDEETTSSELKEGSLAWNVAARRKLGAFLFDKLFAGPVRERLIKSLDALHIHCSVDRGAKALRIRLAFGAPGDPPWVDSVTDLASLPWELLFFPGRPHDEGHLALNIGTPVVRDVDAPVYLAPLEVDPPLQVLVVESCPRAEVPLELAKELHRVGEALEDTSHIRVTLLENATFDGLRKALEGEFFHVLHYLGHGETGRIILENSRGERDPVSAKRLAGLIRKHSSLRLAVLNTCWSAKLAACKPEAPLAGMASELALAGLPAVVAMQFAIGDTPAIDFADAFYAALVRNEPLELAVTRGRRAIRERALLRARNRDESAEDRARALRESVEWSTPVLYMRGRTGRLFEVSPVLEVFGIRFRQVAGIHLAERPLTREDWDRIEGLDPELPSEPPEPRPLTGKTIAAIESLFRRSRCRVRRETGNRVAELRLPTKDELKRAFDAGGRGLREEDVPYHYCTTGDELYPYAAIKGSGAEETVTFQHNGWHALYSPGCVVRPVIEMREGGESWVGGPCREGMHSRVDRDPWEKPPGAVSDDEPEEVS